MTEAVTGILLVLGSAFVFLSAVGLVRMPDLFSRMQAATKASTLGIGLILLGVAIYFSNLAVTTRAFLVVAFVFMTAPVAAHMIGRAAYFLGVPLWEGTITDELRARYDPQTHRLQSPPGARE
jgi:multicomponent Na+:H+ antiporter subunit G